MAAAIRTTCPYCGVGCGVLVEPAEAARVAVRGDPDHPANFGRLCSKGSALAETIDLDGRLLHPEILGARVGWDAALDLVAGTFARAIAEHGPDAVAFYVSGQLLTEDYYVANKLMKGFIGSANIDTNSRLCMASAVAGHRRAFGSDTVPGTYEDLELADLVVLVGSNLAWCHPVLYQRIARAKQERPDMQVVLIDPRRTATCDIADLHLPIGADGDAALFVGLLGHLERAGRIDHAYVAAHTTGIEAALSPQLDLASVAAMTGLEAASVERFYRLWSTTERTVTVFSQGVNQSSVGTDKVNAIINCHLATGRIGRPGMGPFSIAGQPNAMGGREVGGLANMLAAHMAIESPSDRARVQRFWASPTMATRPGLKAVDLFRAVADGRIKAIWIMATNPVDSMPDADGVKAALAACPFVVVSDMTAETDTARLAHVLLPAAGWGEKDGSVTNSERCISRQRPFMPAPGEARADWRIICDVARRMGFGPAFDFAHPAEIFAEHAALSGFENDGGRSFDIGAVAALDRDAYDALRPFQWPAPSGRQEGARCFADGRFHTPDGKARFVAIAPRPERLTDAAHPMVLNTGRVRDHWHTMTRTGKSPRLSQHLAEPFAELHPADAARLGIGDADLVTLSAEGHAVVLRALITQRQAPGAVFVPMHWNDQFASAARIDALLQARPDPVSGQPATKHGAVAVTRFQAGCYGFAVLAERPAAIEAAYWALSRCPGGWRIEFALAAGQHDGEDFWSRLTGGMAGNVLRYRDDQNARLRFACFAGDLLQAALFVAPEPVGVARDWAVGLLTTRLPDAAARLAVLAGRPGGGQRDRGRIVCVCLHVGSLEILEAADQGCRTVEAIGERLQAGTNCGSCRPEIGALISTRATQRESASRLDADAVPAV